MDDDDSTARQAIQHLRNAEEICTRSGRAYAAFLISMAVIELTTDATEKNSNHDKAQRGQGA